MSMTKPILVVGDLDEDEQGEVIIRGYITKESIVLMHTGPYQRSANFSPSKTRKLVKAIEAGKIRRFPDVILGMRGHRWDSVNRGIALRDPVYLIDGVQRTFAWKLASDDHPDKTWGLGVKVYINTTQDIEAAMFRDLNTGHTAMAPSVILRNEKEHSRVAGMLFGLSHQEDFALRNRVAWDQSYNRSVNGDLLRGAVMLHILRALHSHKLQGVGRGSRGGSGILDVLRSTDSQIDSIGLMKARENLVTFFDVVDQAWGIRNYTTGMPAHMHWGWLNTLARIFSDHTEFWRDDGTFRVPSTLLSNLKTKVDPADEALATQARGNKSAREVLYTILVKRINRQGLTNREEIRKERQRAEDRASEERRDQPGA
jgi:hypothetical protein